MSSSANPTEPSALNLRYQVGIRATARECRLVGGIVSMKVGVQGRIILGPAGGPGEVQIPLRVAIVQEGVEPKTVVSRLQEVTVTVPPNDSNVPFTHVEDGLTFPMPPGGAIDSYIVYVGFDPIGAQELEKKKPRRKPVPGRR